MTRRSNWNGRATLAGLALAALDPEAGSDRPGCPMCSPSDPQLNGCDHVQRVAMPAWRRRVLYPLAEGATMAQNGKDLTGHVVAPSNAKRNRAALSY